MDYEKIGKYIGSGLISITGIGSEVTRAITDNQYTFEEIGGIVTMILLTGFSVGGLIKEAYEKEPDYGVIKLEEKLV